MLHPVLGLQKQCLVATALDVAQWLFHCGALLYLFPAKTLARDVVPETLQPL